MFSVSSLCSSQQIPHLLWLTIISFSTNLTFSTHNHPHNTKKNLKIKVTIYMYVSQIQQQQQKEIPKSQHQSLSLSLSLSLSSQNHSISSISPFILPNAAMTTRRSTNKKITYLDMRFGIWISALWYYYTSSLLALFIWVCDLGDSEGVGMWKCGESR